MKTDARVRYTKMIIKKSFISLLKERPINKITVKAICEMSEINRATFYKYYNDPFDLMEKIEEEMLEELEFLTEQPKEDNLADSFILILKRIRQNEELYQAIVSENGDCEFAERIFDIFYKRTEVSMDTEFSHMTGTQREWLYYYMAKGCSGVLGRWIKNGMREPEAEVAVFISRLVNSINKEFKK